MRRNDSEGLCRLAMALGSRKVRYDEFECNREQVQLDRSRSHRTGKAGRCSRLRIPLPSALPAGIQPVLAHDQKSDGSRGFDATSIPATFSKKIHVPPGIRFFNL